MTSANDVSAVIQLPQEDIGSHQNKDAGRDHGRGVNQRADRRRTSHRVRQPDEERDLRRLAGDAQQHKERDQER